MNKIEKDEWLRRATQRYKERVGDLSEEQARDFAEASYEGFPDEDPEDVVDEDLSNWGD